QFFLCYLQDGGRAMVIDQRVPRSWTAYDARNGSVLGKGILSEDQPMIGTSTAVPTVVICKRSDVAV
ncbi:MAG: hypothetical protein ACQKBT_11350, partial [Puniceicoccales bacterium]